MARLAVAAVLLTFLVVALCRVIDGEVDQVVASPYYPFEPPQEEAVLPDGAYVEYNGAAGTSIAFVPPYLDGAARDEAAASAAAQSYVLPAAKAAMSPEGPVIPVDDADQQGFLRFPCRYRHMRWARRHGGFYRHHGEGFHGNEKQLVAEMPVEPATHGEELREEAVVVPVVEPDPDSRQDAAIAADEPVHGELEDEDEMARFHHGRRSHHHHRHHHHQDEHEEAYEASPVERFRFHHHHHHHEEDEHEQREEGAPMKWFRHHHDDKEKEAEMRTSKRFHHHYRDKDDDSDDERELEEMARRWIRKALMRSKIHHHHHHLRFRHGAQEDAAAGEEEEKGGVMSWLKDFVNRF